MSISIIDAAGARQEIDLDVSIYKEAADKRLSVPQLLSAKYPTDANTYGSTFEQVMAASGLFLKGDRKSGIIKATLGEILEPQGGIGAGVVTRDATPMSRLIFPAVVEQAMENKLREDTDSDVAIFNSMVALSDDIDGDQYQQPLLDFAVPEAARSQPISQLSEPATMMTLKVSEVSRTIPSFALGMVVSEKAFKAATIDFVALSLARQAEIEQAKLIDSYLNSMIAGDVDFGMTALPSVKANTFDSSIVANGAITHRAWIKWLRRNSRVRKIDWVICDVDTYLAIEGRAGKPTVNSDDPNSPRIDALLNAKNVRIGNVNVFLVESGVLPANAIIGLDSRYAIRKVRNLNANYRAQEQLVMRRGEALRWDWSEMCYRMFDQGWDYLSLTI